LRQHGFLHRFTAVIFGRRSAPSQCSQGVQSATSFDVRVTAALPPGNGHSLALQYLMQ
jgi:hypothetical protein